MKIKLTNKLIYSIAIINALFLILVWGVDKEYDTTSYIDAWNNSWANGQMDILRTPIYPLFIGLTKFCFGRYYEYSIIFIQHIVFIISIYYFNKMIAWEIDSHKLVWWLTFIYAILPATSTYASCILTESFAIIGTVFLFYNIVAFKQTAQISRIWWVTGWLAFLILLRPSSLYLIPAVLLFWILYLKTKKRLAIYGILGVIAVSVMEIGYCAEFKQEYGIFAPSSVSTINQFTIAHHYNLLDSKNTDIIKYDEFIKTHNGDCTDLAIFIWLNKKIDEVGLNNVQSIISTIRTQNRLAWYKSTINNFDKALTEPLLFVYGGSNHLRDLFGINFNILYLFLIIYIVMLIKNAIRTHKIAIMESLLLITYIGNLLLVMIGAHSEWGRLLLPSLPLLIFMFGFCLRHVAINKLNNYKR